MSVKSVSLSALAILITASACETNGAWADDAFCRRWADRPPVIWREDDPETQEREGDTEQTIEQAVTLAIFWEEFCNGRDVAPVELLPSGDLYAPN